MLFTPIPDVHASPDFTPVPDIHTIPVMTRSNVMLPDRRSPPIATRLLFKLSSTLTGCLVSLLVLTGEANVLAHGGHGNEFQAGGQATQLNTAIPVDPAAAQRLGLRVESVTRQPLAIGIKTTGQIEPLPNQQVAVTTPVGGTLLRLLVAPGAVVQAGQPVAMMTSPELAELRTSAFDRQAAAIAARQTAAAELRLAQHNYQQQQRIAATEIQQAQTELAVAQERYEKDKQLLEQGAIARRLLLESETRLAAARNALAKAESRLHVSEAAAQLQRAQANLRAAQSQVHLSEAAYRTRLRQLGAKPNADGTITITAPIAGMVADRQATLGESGQDAGKPIMTIVNPDRVQVVANIYEKDVQRIRLGQRVRVKLGSSPDRSLEGRISMIGAVVDAETRVVPVKAELVNPDGVLRPGQFVELEVLTDRTPTAVLAIPKSALVETNDNKTLVFVQNGTAFQPVELELGQEAGDWVEVKDGLFDGDRIVTQRAIQLYAQSLRTNATQTDVNHQDIPTPSADWRRWMVLPLGGLVLVGGFMGGVYWAKRGDHNHDHNHPPSTYLPLPFARNGGKPCEAEQSVPQTQSSHSSR